MRVSRVEFSGYRRLARTATNIDGQITAFVGFNEAGKTSLLRALDWFDEDSELLPADRNRSRPPRDESDPVVKVYFELRKEDEELLSSIPMEDTPTSLVIYKRSDGRKIWQFHPRPKRPTRPFQSAAIHLEKSRRALGAQLASDETAESLGPGDWAAMVSDALLEPDEDWPEQSRDALDALSAWLNEVPDGRKRARDEGLARLLTEVGRLVSLGHPNELAWEALYDHVPQFVLFREEDRALQTSYSIQPEQRDLSPAVDRLLKLAGLDIDVMWTHVENEDSSQRATALERANERLQALFDRTWNQSKVTVRLNMYGARLEVMIKELRDGGDVTNISERSDGLKTFVALVAFLESGEYATPPVLLIDEAETHLHYDAQADLVGVLLRSVNASQVLYTTHSPGCLPGDLGTGIRVLARDPENGDASLLKNNFWHGEGPGFSPLLFAMGAGAAAFSVCRNAVLAEGAADMVLLPSLIRQATELDDLDYQVAPGLANAHGSGIRVEEVAAKVVYLIDGDKGGANHRQLLEDAGVDVSRIYALPNGQAVEDLVMVEGYLAVVNKFLADMGQEKIFELSDVPAGSPISTSLSIWAKSNKVRIPSKVEVAYALLRENVHLTPAGKETLIELHKEFSASFEKVRN